MVAPARIVSVNNDDPHTGAGCLDEPRTAVPPHRVGNESRRLRSHDSTRLNRFGVPGRLDDAGLDATPEFVNWHLEIMQLHANAKVAGRCAQVVPFDSRPESEVEDHAQPELHRVLGKSPELTFDPLLSRCVPRARAECPQPLIRRQPQGAPVRRQLTRKRGLPRAR